MYTQSHAHMHTHTRALTGEMAVEWLKKHMRMTTEEAVSVGGQLYARQYIVHVVDRDKGFSNDYLFYVFTVSLSFTVSRWLSSYFLCPNAPPPQPEAHDVYKSSEVYQRERRIQQERLSRPNESMLTEMMDSKMGVDIRDRKYLLTWYKRCFVGKRGM